MNQYIAPPEKTEEEGDEGFDAWYDVWIEQDGSVGSYLGFHDDATAAATVKLALQRELEELVGGRTKRLPNKRNPSTDIDLGLRVVMLRVVHQRNGQTSSGWGPCGADPRVLRPLSELATIAAVRLADHPVGEGRAI